MRSHVKNILAGVGTGAVVVLLAVLSIMSFASISGSERDVSLTVVKETVPKSDPNASVDETAFLFHLYKANGDGTSEERPFGDKLFWLVDDDGVEPDPSIPNDTEPPTSLTRTFKIPSGGDDERYFLKEEGNEYAFKYKTYYTTWACYVADQYPSGTPFAKGFGRDANIDFSEKDNVVCKFTNTATDAKLTVKKIFDPSISENVQFYIQRDNNNYDEFTLVDGQSREVFLTSGHEFYVREQYNQKNLKTGFLKYETSYSCDNSINGSGLNFDLGLINSGDDIKCTFTNKKSPEISIKKTVISGDKNKKFDFELNFYDRNKALNRSVPLSLGDSEIESELYGTLENGWTTKIIEKADRDYSVSYECKIYSHTGDLLNTLKDDKSEVSLPVLDFGQKVECEFFNKQTQITFTKNVLDENGNDIENDSNEKFFINNLNNRQGLSFDDNASTVPPKEILFKVNSGVVYSFNEEFDENNLYRYNVSYLCTDDQGSEFAKGDLKKDPNNKNITETFSLPALNPGQNISCVITNKLVAPTTIFIKKDVVNYLGQDIQSTDTFKFKYTESGVDKEFILDDNSDGTYSNTEKIIVKSGISYTFEELLNQNQKYNVSWSCTNNTSDNGTSFTTTMGEGESMTCTFTNKEFQKATIQILKDAVPVTNDIFIFNVLDENKQLVDVMKARGNGTIDPNLIQELDVNAGSYIIEESLQTNGKAYTTNYICEFSPSRKPGNDLVGKGRFVPEQENPPNPPKFITLAPGETVACNFFNVESAKVVITKATFPTTVNEDFEIKVNSNNEPAFTLNPQTRPTSGEIGVEAEKSFTITENLSQLQIDKYDTSWVCDDNTSGNSRTINVSKVAGGATLKCTFTNKIKPTVTVIKKTTPTILDQEFTVNMVQGLRTWILKYNTAQNKTTYTNSVQANTGFTITEKQESGITTTWICDNGRKGNGVGPISVSGMDYGTKLTCTFTNCKGSAGSLCPSYPDPDGDQR